MVILIIMVLMATSRINRQVRILPVKVLVRVKELRMGRVMELTLKTTVEAAVEAAVELSQNVLYKV